MDRRLIEAARGGDIHELRNLIKEDQLILREVALTRGESPLHIACLGGHVNFVKEVLNLNPEFATELNQEGFSPLHIASANGDIQIVKEMLKIGSHLCLVKGKEKRIPLHFAVAKGRTKVIQELLSTCSDSITEVTVRGENCFHLAVKNSQFEAFKLLVDHVILHKKAEILNSRDGQGNSILHLATYRKQYEVIQLLLDENFPFKSKLEVNSLNKKGVTPLDVLTSEGGDFEIDEMLRSAGGARVEEGTNSFPSPNLVISRQEQRRDVSECLSKRLQNFFKYDKIKDSPSKVRNTLLVIAVLIATATYQPVLSPPGGVWQDDFWPSPNNNTADGSVTKSPPPHTAGQSVMGTHNPVAYGLFLLFNSIGFFMSLHMLNFLTLGFPLQFELRVCLMALTATYDTCLVAIISDSGGTISVLFIVMSVVMPALMPILTKVVRDVRKLRRFAESSTRSSA